MLVFKQFCGCAVQVAGGHLLPRRKQGSKVGRVDETVLIHIGITREWLQRAPLRKQCGTVGCVHNAIAIDITRSRSAESSVDGERQRSAASGRA